MPNTIQTMGKYLPFLDEKYRAETTSSIMDAPPEIYRETEDAKTIMLPVMKLDGLGDYSRSDGFVKGDATIEYKPYTFSCDRGRMFTVDAFDDAETAAVAFGRLAGEFISAHVGPELDAYRYSKYATVAISETTQYSSTTPSEANIISELDLAIEVLDNAEVPDADRVLFMSSTAYNFLKKSQGAQSRVTNAGLDRRIEYFDGTPIVKVPKSRMYTAFEFLSGGDGKTAGGFTPVSGASVINFILMSKKTPIQIVKAAKLKIVTPEQNPDADSYKFGYRLYHDTFVPENKKLGIYCNIG